MSWMYSTVQYVLRFYAMPYHATVCALYLKHSRPKGGQIEANTVSFSKGNTHTHTLTLVAKENWGIKPRGP